MNEKLDLGTYGETDITMTTVAITVHLNPLDPTPILVLYDTYHSTVWYEILKTIITAAVVPVDKLIVFNDTLNITVSLLITLYSSTYVRRPLRPGAKIRLCTFRKPMLSLF